MVNPDISSVISAEGVVEVEEKKSVEEKWKLVVEKIRKFDKDSKVCAIC